MSGGERPRLPHVIRARIQLRDLPTDGEWAHIRPAWCRDMMERAPVRAWVLEDETGRALCGTDLYIEGPEEDVRKMVNAFREATHAHGGYSVDFIKAALA